MFPPLVHTVSILAPPEQVDAKHSVYKVWIRTSCKSYNTLDYLNYLYRLISLNPRQWHSASQQKVFHYTQAVKDRFRKTQEGIGEGGGGFICETVALKNWTKVRVSRPAGGKMNAHKFTWNLSPSPPPPPHWPEVPATLQPNWQYASQAQGRGAWN